MARSVTIPVGDVRQRLRELPDESVHCGVTSPPWWGLRAYLTQPQVWGSEPACKHRWNRGRCRVNAGVGVVSSSKTSGRRGPRNTKRIRKARRREHDICRKCGAWRGELGLEPTPERYVEHVVEVFREIRRVLRPDASVWLNMGDCYAGSGSPGGDYQDGRGGDTYLRPYHRTGAGLKPKDLVGIPRMVAFALRANGWWLRSDIIWAKGVSFCPAYAGSVMPESARDRPTKGHEYLFLLTKTAKYFYDNEAMKERASGKTHSRGQGVNPKARRPTSWDESKGSYRELISGYPRRKQNRSLSGAVAGLVSRRNLRTVWTIPTQPYPEAHFATFPEKLVEPCIKAGTSEKGCCPKCGAPWERIVKKTRRKRGPARRTDTSRDIHGRRKRRKLDAQPENAAGRRLCANVRKARAASGHHDNPFLPSETVGWKPSCNCDAGEPVPCVVLDPFLGSGTTALVALRLGRSVIGIELKPEHAEMARRRIERITGCRRSRSKRCPRAVGDALERI